MTDANGFYDFGYNVYAYPFSPALIFAYALNCEPSGPQIIFITSNYYFNIILEGMVFYRVTTAFFPFFSFNLFDARLR